MLRNQDVKKLLITLIIITGLATIGAAIYSVIAALFVVGTALIFSCVFIYYTRRRYQDIERLSSYLRQISAGDYSLDIRDNDEGELSILKSELYKMTLMLSEQGNQLRADKIHLMDAISDISHQLKTPLTSMTVMADLLENPELPQGKRQEFNRNIQVQLERIEWLVSSLLKLSKIDAGAIEFKKDNINVKHLVEKALEPVLIPIDIKNIDITLSGDEMSTYTGDWYWSVEALLNIIKNCVDHLPEGEKLDINFSENALYTEINVVDYGEGIRKEDLPYIFKRFYKGKNASEDSVGIGLAMAYAIITEQQGTIDVTSELGIGTTFQIKFYKYIV